MLCLYTHIYMYTNMVLLFSHKWNLIILFFKLLFALNSMSYKLLYVSEYRSMAQYPEILNYVYFPQCTTLFCALKGKHLLFLKEAPILWNLSFCENFTVFFFFVVLIYLLLPPHLTSSSLRTKNGLFTFISYCLTWDLIYRSSFSILYMIIFN